MKPLTQERHYDVSANKVKHLEQGLKKAEKRIAELALEVELAKISIQEKEERYLLLFDEAPICLWEADCSRLKSYIDGLKKKGVRNFRRYFETNPKAVHACVSSYTEGQIFNLDKRRLRSYQ